uniref:Uncharacterized protein n=1 Tax=Myotis myotis TaxID=51298 RepID=A0A7J7RC78_MYOMY|nr:hypothetical protein mMyoMyo1_010848 [Myotis myotis]
MYTGSVVVWREPALPRALNLQEKVSCLPSDEQRAALLPFLESFSVQNDDIQDLGHFQFGIFGHKSLSRCFLICSQCFIRQAAFYIGPLWCSPNNAESFWVPVSSSKERPWWYRFKSPESAVMSKGHKGTLPRLL